MFLSHAIIKKADIFNPFDSSLIIVLNNYFEYAIASMNLKYCTFDELIGIDKNRIDRYIIPIIIIIHRLSAGVRRKIKNTVIFYWKDP